MMTKLGGPGQASAAHGRTVAWLASIGWTPRDAKRIILACSDEEAPRKIEPLLRAGSRPVQPAASRSPARMAKGRRRVFQRDELGWSHAPNETGPTQGDIFVAVEGTSKPDASGVVRREAREPTSPPRPRSARPHRSVGRSRRGPSARGAASRGPQIGQAFARQRSALDAGSRRGPLSLAGSGCPRLRPASR